VALSTSSAKTANPANPARKKTPARKRRPRVFHFLSRLFRRRKERQGLFLARTQTRTWWVDPMPAARRMEELLGADWPKLAAKLYQPQTPPPPDMPPESLSGVLRAEREAKAEAAKRLADAAADALGMPPLTADGQGFTEAERTAVAVGFVAHLIDLAESARPL
jgi:hypothetical protein